MEKREMSERRRNRFEKRSWNINSTPVTYEIFESILTDYKVIDRIQEAQGFHDILSYVLIKSKTKTDLQAILEGPAFAIATNIDVRKPIVDGIRKVLDLQIKKGISMKDLGYLEISTDLEQPSKKRIEFAWLATKGLCYQYFKEGKQTTQHEIIKFFEGALLPYYAHGVFSLTTYAGILSQCVNNRTDLKNRPTIEQLCT